MAPDCGFLQFLFLTWHPDLAPGLVGGLWMCVLNCGIVVEIPANFMNWASFEGLLKRGLLGCWMWEQKTVAALWLTGSKQDIFGFC